MAESMRGMKRSHRCTEVSKANIGEIVTVMGWDAEEKKSGKPDFHRSAGSLRIFYQIVFDSNDVSEAGMEKAATLRSEFVVAVTGKVIARAGAVNENLATGDIEVQAHELRILSESETPPFPIEENIQTKDELRLKYRYLDLRRPNLQRNPDAAEQGGNRGSEIPGRRGIPGDRDPHPD